MLEEELSKNPLDKEKEIKIRLAMLAAGEDQAEQLFDEHDFIGDAELVSLVAYIDIGKFLTSPAMWAGVVVCGLFITAAIYVRRYRDDS